MSPFNRLLIGMDLTYMDTQVLNYLLLLGKINPQAEAYFLHVVRSLEIPVRALAGQPENALELIPEDERIQAHIEDLVETNLAPEFFTRHIDVKEGRITPELLHWAHIKKSDLAILGRRKSTTDHGVEAIRFLRNTDSSVWFVPENSPKEIKRILVATDFSESANIALQYAIDLAMSLEEKPTLIPFHVYDVPSELHYRLNRTYTQFADIVRQNLSEFFPDYLDKFQTENLELRPELAQNLYLHKGRHIHEYAEACDADLIVIGAKGHTAFSSFLLGSVTEKLASVNENIPLLVVRPPV